MNNKRNLRRAFNGTITRGKAEKMKIKAGVDSPGPAAYTIANADMENVYISQGKRFTVLELTLNTLDHQLSHSVELKK